MPRQPLALGVTVTTPVVGTEPLFIPTNDSAFPEPLAGSPMLSLVFVQLYVVAQPNMLTPVKTKEGKVLVLHTDWFGIAVKTGEGLTIIVKACGVPVQLFAVGVTVIVAVIVTVVVFVATNAGMLPVPVAAKPMVLLLHDQL